DQKQQLQRGLVGREVPPGADCAAEFGVQRLNGIRCVEDAADLGWEGIEGYHLAPGTPPTLADGRVFAAPLPYLEGRQGRLGGGGVDGAVDVLERCRDCLAVFVGDEVEAQTQQVDDAGLHRRLWEDGQNGVGKPLQAIDHGDQDVFDAAVAQFVHHP